MKILMTGGTGVVGIAVMRELLKRGNDVRLLSRHAGSESAQFPGEQETVDGNVADANSIRGAADGCDAVVHIAGIVSETPPDVTFYKVNVQGTENLLREAERAGVKLFLHMSSLGADIGKSNYHMSKLQAEKLVQEFDGDWLILRPGNVYGPGDEVVSLLLRMVRSLPAIPVIDGGDLPSQPIYADDLAEAVGLALEREEVWNQVHEVSGEDLLSMNEMLDKMAELTGKKPARLPLPGWLAEAGTTMMKKLGVDIPFSPDQITMLTEGNRIQPGRPNALTEVFGVKPISVDEGLKRLVQSQPEQTPKDGQGSLHYRRVAATIAGSSMSSEQIFDHICSNFGNLMPSFVASDPEPGETPKFCQGATLTLGLPVRGNVQVRVVEHTANSATCLTLTGHPLAGAVIFSVEDSPAGPTVEIQTYDRAATLTDQIAMATVGRPVQTFTWQTFAANVAESVGGEVAGRVEVEERDLEDEEAKPYEEWLEKLALARKKNDMEKQINML